MAGDKKISDLAIGFAIGLFVLGVFTYAIIDMDNNTNNNELKTLNPDTTYLNLNTEDADSTVYKNIFNTSSFILLQGQQIDTRGQGEVNIMAQNKHSTITSFFSNASLTKWDYHGLIVKLILGLIGIISGILLLRSMLGTNRV